MIPGMSGKVVADSQAEILKEETNPDPELIKTSPMVGRHAQNESYPKHKMQTE